jgi:hypothetical protein
MNRKKYIYKQIRKIIFFIGCFLLIGTFVYLLFRPVTIDEASAGWFNDGWKFRQRLPISYSGTETLTDYQLLLENFDTATLVTAGKMQSDCDDIRFVAENGELLEYSIVPKTCNTTATSIWVKTLKIDANPRNIYIYYGNPYAQSYQDMKATFSYSSSKVVGYVMDSGVDDLNVISLSENNSITHNGTTITLGPGQTDTSTFSPTGTAVSQWGSISAKGLFNADDNTENTDLFVPVSWAGTEFEYWVRAPNGNAAVSFFMLSPWSTLATPSTVTIYNAGVSAGTHSVYGATGTTGTYTGTGNQTDGSRYFRVSSTRPILLFVRAYGAGNHANVMPVKPNSTYKWIGSGGNSIIMNGSSSLNYGFFRNGAAGETTGTVAANDKTNAFTGGSNYGGQAYLVRSTNSVYSFGVYQYDDNDGPYESHYYNDITEQGTIFGSANQADYISVASTQAATCKLYDVTSTGGATLKSTGTLTSSNTEIYFYGFNTGSTTAYTTTYGWFMECDTPVVAYYQKPTVTEANLMSHVMMRQFTFPTPSFGVNASEEAGPAPGGYWKMDEGADNTCTGGVNDVCDSTNNINDGALTEAVWQVSDSCVSGRCLLFDGTNDNVSIPAGNSINLNTATGYTVCGWINPDSDGEGNTGEWWSKGNSYMRVDSESGGRVNVTALFDLATTDASYTSVGTIPINDWSHVCAGWTDDGDDELALYINGKLDGSSTNGNGSPGNDSAAIMYIGGDTTNNFDGYIDELKVFRYQRTLAEIINDYNAGTGQTGSPKGSAFSFGGSDTDGSNLNSNLQSRWEFDDGAGDILGDAISANAGNLAGAGTTCPAVSSACPSWNDAGIFDKALDFDGTDDYVQVAAASNINMNGKTGYSVCGWIYPDSSGEGGAGKWWAKGNTYIRTDTQSGSTVKVSALFDLSGSDASYTSISTIPISQWSNVCITYADDGDDEITMYIDGVFSGVSTNGSGSPVNDSSDSLYIGGDSSNNFDGKIDQITVYNSELTASEVKIAKNQGKGVSFGYLSTDTDGKTTTLQGNRQYCVPGDTSTCTSPLAEWKFDENSGTSSVYDSSNNEYTGTMTGSMTAGDWVPGKYGTALDFDGSDDYISIGAGPATVKTVSFWAYPRSTTQYFVELNGSTYVWSNAGTLTATGFSAPTVYVNGKSSSTITANTWQFITITTTNNINASALNIGKYSTNYYNGLIDNVRLYDYTKTPAQIAWEYDQGKPFAYYKFEECEGNTINNSIENNNHGTLTIGGSGTQTSIGTCPTSGFWANSTSGKYSVSANFDGTDDYVQVGNTGNSMYSLSFWLKPDATTDNVLDLDGGTHYISILNSDIVASGFSTPTIYIDGLARTTLPDITNWHHVVIVSNTSFSASNVVIGLSGGNYYDGRLDDLKLFSYPLNRSQVLVDYNRASSVNLSN